VPESWASRGELRACGAADSADDCVGVLRTEQDGRPLLRDLEQLRAQAFVQLGWTLECENAGGKVTCAPGRDALRAPASGDQSAFASAAACGKQSWRIEA